MTARFHAQPFGAAAGKREGQKGVALFKVRQGDTGMLSADAIGVAEVGVGQLGGEQTGVAAAFGRTEFNLTFSSHGMLRWMKGALKA